MLLYVLLFGALMGCNKAEPAITSAGPEDLIGFWKLENWLEDNNTSFIAVPSDAGLEIYEKSQMMEFRSDGFFRKFFWNWCGTPPVIPSDWMPGQWQELSEGHIEVQFSEAVTPRHFEIIELNETHLVIHWID